MRKLKIERRTDADGRRAEERAEAEHDEWCRIHLDEWPGEHGKQNVYDDLMYDEDNFEHIRV